MTDLATGDEERAAIAHLLSDVEKTENRCWAGCVADKLESAQEIARRWRAEALKRGWPARPGEPAVFLTKSPKK